MVQTPVMAARLAKNYGVDSQRISIVPQPIPQHLSIGMMETVVHPQIAACRKPIKLLFLAAYYPHKNHGILPFVAEELRRRDLAGKVQIFVTLDDTSVPPTEAAKWLNRYPEFITNLGRVPRP